MNRSGSVESVEDAQKEIARRMLGMQLHEASESATSVMEVASHMEKPGVQTPSKAHPHAKAKGEA
jgi:hypothetical protein